MTEQREGRVGGVDGGVGRGVDGRVVVLAGGLSHERDVSLRSGRRVAEALRGAGLEVEERDVDATLLPALRADRPACVFPLLHGETGEDGALREVLELVRLPYVGSTPEACRVAFDKPVAKTLVSRAGLATPESVTLPHETFREVGAAAMMDALVERLGLPLVVKPVRGGSALGCTVVRDVTDLPGAMVGCFAYGPIALVERFVTGTEVTVSVVDTAEDGPRALPAVEIRPDSGVYDYSARYTAGATEFVVPAKLSDEVARSCAEVAVHAHRTLGLRDFSRSDLIVDEGRVWFLEVNVAPGMTETSLVPLAIEADGLDLGEVCADLVRSAVARV